MRYTEFKTTLETALNSDGAVILPSTEELTDHADTVKQLSFMWPYKGVLPYRLLVKEITDEATGRVSKSIIYWPKVFLHTAGMGGQFDGSGIILGDGRAFKFNMCDHEWDCSGANHSRGWHPKRCTKCGFDASIDSGD